MTFSCSRFAADRDEAAFAELVRRHGPLVRGVARRRLADAHEADDVAQATFLNLAHRAGRVGGRPLAPWLFTVAHRLACKAQARAARRNQVVVQASRLQEAGGTPAPQFADPLADITARELIAALDDELARLPDRYRLPLVLCALKGLSRDEAAAQLGWTLGSLRGRLERGRELLRRRLTARGLTVPAVLASGLLATAAEAMPAALVRAITHAAMALPPATVPVKTLLVAAVVLVALGVGTGTALLPGGQPEPKANPPVPAAGAEPPIAASPPKQDDEPTWTVVDGIVVDEGGKPIAGATVRFLIPYKASGPAAADAAGRFRLAFYCGVARSEWLVAESPDGRRLGYEYLRAPPALHLATRIECRPPRTIRIHTVDGHGQPVAGARTAVMVRGIMALAHSATDKTGTTTLRVPAQASPLQALAFRPGVGFDYTDELQPGGAGVPADVTLRLDGVHTARVKVSDSAGRPIPGISLGSGEIHKRGREAGIWLTRFIPGAEVRTAADGVATFDWLPRDLRGMVQFDNFDDRFCLGSATYDPNRDTGPVSMQLVRPVQVGGRITRADGRPAAGVLVRVDGRGPMQWGGKPPHNIFPTRDAPSYEGDTRSGADGVYHLKLPPGQSFIIAANDADAVAPSQHRPTLDEAKEGVVLTGIDLRLGEGTIIRGRVTAGNPPRPAAGIGLRLVEEGPILPGPRAPILRPTLYYGSKTDADGRYHFRVGPGSYQLWPPGEDSKPELFRVANQAHSNVRLDGDFARTLNRCGTGRPEQAGRRRQRDGSIGVGSGRRRS